MYSMWVYYDKHTDTFAELVDVNVIVFGMTLGMYLIWHWGRLLLMFGAVITRLKHHRKARPAPPLFYLFILSHLLIVFEENNWCFKSATRHSRGKIHFVCNGCPYLSQFCETQWRHRKPFWMAFRWKQCYIRPPLPCFNVLASSVKTL